jgi:hypothetical protein
VVGITLVATAAFRTGASSGSQAPVDSASFVPDDNRGFQLDLPLAAGDTVLVHCAFYDRGAGGSEKRIVVYREASPRTRLGLPVGDGWTIAAECAGREGEPTVLRRGRIDIPPPIVLPLRPHADRGRGRTRETLLVVAWTRRPNGHWAQLERYSVLEQRTGTMYQFGDFRVDCCLDAASAYVIHVRPRADARNVRE